MEYKEADKDQTLYHPLAHVIVNEDIVMINGREYEIIANVKDALDIEMLKEKYDPYLSSLQPHHPIPHRDGKEIGRAHV